MKKMKNNKGVAMIIALIAILFISVLASSLLYLSYMNNQMKTMHRYSTDNFYTAEYALDDMLSQLKQYSSIQTNPAEKLEQLLNPSGDNSTLNTSAVEDMIDIESVMPDVFDDGGSVKVDSIYSSGSYSKVGNSIWMKGVRITVTTNEKSGSLKSTIVTDIELRFPSSASGKGKLNDFSLLADSPIWIISSSQYFCGDLYVRANENTSIGKTVAFRVGGKAVVNVLSNFAFIDGDLVVEDTGLMYLSGTTYVHGNITVDSKASLNVGGTLYCSGTISGDVRKGPNGTVYSGGAGGVDWDYYEDNYSDGLASKLLADSVHIHLGSSTSYNVSSYGDGWSGTQYNAALTQARFKDIVTDGQISNGNGKLTSIDYNGRTISAIYLTNNVQHNFENTLVISAVPLDNFHGTVKNCTMVNINTDSKGIIKIGTPQQWANAWGTMDDEAYDIARHLCFAAQSGRDIGGSTVQYGTATNADSAPGLLMREEDMTKTGDAEWKVGGKTIHEYNGGGANVAHYYYEDGNARHQYFPYRNLFVDDLDIKLGEFMYGTSSSGDPSANTQPKIFLYNWSKE